MSNSYPLAMPPAAMALSQQVDALDKKSRKELEQAFRQMIIQRGRVHLAQQAIAAYHLAALETVSQTLSTAELIKAMYGSAALAGYAEIDEALHQQFLSAIGQANAIANHKAISWLVED